MPSFDLSQVGDRQKVIKLMNAYYKMVTDLGGSITGQLNDGRLRGPYVEMMYGSQLYQIFQQIKQAFDPYGSLNPGVKIDVKLNDTQKQIRSSYDLKHLYNFMPRI